MIQCVKLGSGMLASFIYWFTPQLAGVSKEVKLKQGLGARSLIWVSQKAGRAQTPESPSAFSRPSMGSWFGSGAARSPTGTHGMPASQAVALGVLHNTGTSFPF